MLLPPLCMGVGGFVPRGKYACQGCMGASSCPAAAEEAEEEEMELLSSIGQLLTAQRFTMVALPLHAALLGPCMHATSCPSWLSGLSCCPAGMGNCFMLTTQ